MELQQVVEKVLSGDVWIIVSGKPSTRNIGDIERGIGATKVFADTAHVGEFVRVLRHFHGAFEQVPPRKFRFANLSSIAELQPSIGEKVVVSDKLSVRDGERVERIILVKP